MSTPAKAAPQPTPETEPFWTAAREGRLDLPKCDACGEAFFYPRLACPRCASTDVSWITASGRATLHSYVISHRPAPGFDGPTVIAVVETEEGPRMMSNIVGVEPDPANLELDMPLQVDFEERGEWSVPVFRPAGEGAR